MRKGEGPVDLQELIRTVQEKTSSCTQLERLDVAVKYGELLRGIGDDLIGHFVDEARKSGASWSQIGERLGVTKQAAHQRHLRREPRMFGRRRDRVSGTTPFERFSEVGKDVVAKAQDEASSMRHNYIGVEHLLLALAGDGGGGAASLLRAAGATPGAVRDQIRLIVGEGREEVRDGPIPFTPRSKGALQLAARTAERAGTLAQPEHVLLGILQLRHGVGIEVLDALDVSKDELRRKTLEALKG
jgi:Clp amino terminal domain, pathogenicity island component